MPNSLETSWTVAHQTPLSRRFPREEYWSGMIDQPQNQEGMKEKSSSPTIPSTSPMALLMIQGCGSVEGLTDFFSLRTQMVD